MCQTRKYVRKLNTYEFSTDQTAANGFNTWFNDVLMRGLIDAEPYCDNSSARYGIEAFQTTLDYAFDNHSREGLLPIHLIDGWGAETLTKGFHQFAFASQYAMLATRLLKKEGAPDSVEEVSRTAVDTDDDTVYTLTGLRLGRMKDIAHVLPKGLYIAGRKKVLLGE